MRFLLTALVWVVILSAVSFLFSVRMPEKTEIAEAVAAGSHNISFEITSTFAVEKDPFALNIGEEQSPFTVTLDGAEIFSRADGISDRVPVIINERELKSGQHEIFVRANPAEPAVSQAVRIKVLQNGNPLKEETKWFEAGQSVNASLKFTLTKEEANNEH